MALSKYSKCQQQHFQHSDRSGLTIHMSQQQQYQREGVLHGAEITNCSRTLIFKARVHNWTFFFFYKAPDNILGFIYRSVLLSINGSSTQVSWAAHPCALTWMAVMANHHTQARIKLLLISVGLKWHPWIMYGRYQQIPCTILGVPTLGKVHPMS